MTKLVTALGALVTFAYFVAMYWLFGHRLNELQTMNLNDVGSFLGGVLGPITFLWLILGYIQQGIELKQNTKALELQAVELRNSVAHQGAMVEVARKQYEADSEALRHERAQFEKSKLPLFLSQNTGGTHSGDKHEYSCHFKNVGHAATKVAFSLNLPTKSMTKAQYPLWDFGEVKAINWAPDNWPLNSEAVITISFIDGLGRPGQENFKLVIEMRQHFPKAVVDKIET